MQRVVDRLTEHPSLGRMVSHVQRPEGCEGRNVLLATPTASGKTLLFALSVLEQIQRSPGSRALIVYPTKALAQGALGALAPPRFEIYDGDTPQATRRRMRVDPALSAGGRRLEPCGSNGSGTGGRLRRRSQVLPHLLRAGCR